VAHRALTMCLVLASAAAWAADWPHWRGPTRDGITSEPSGWPAGWPPKKLWGRNVGRGCSSPVIIGDRLYVMGWQGDRHASGTDTLYCLDARSGADVWKQVYPCRYQGRVRVGDTSAYGGPSSTPSYDAETGWLYTLSTDGDLQCWDTRNGGKRVWGMNLYDAFKAPQRPNVGGGRRDFGYPTSVLIRGDLAIVEVGAKDGTVIAFDKRTAKRRWASQYRKPAGHTGGLVPMTVDGRDCLAVLTLQDLVVMRLDPGHEGETVAATPWATEFACNIGTPAVKGNRVVVSSEYNHSETALFEIGQGARRVWLSKKHALAASPVIHGDNVFLIKGPLQCLDLATGKLRWRASDFANGSCLVTVDDKIIAFGARKVALFEANPKGGQARELARIDRVVSGICYPHVTLAQGLLACKDREGNLVVFSVRPVADTVPPTLVSAHAAGDPTKVRVHFSEPVDASRARFAVDYDVKVVSTELADDARSAVLSVSPLREGGAYTLTVDGIRDRAAKANPMAPGSVAAFKFTPTRRAVDGLVALYTLEEGKGTVVRDVSGFGAALDLVIDKPDGLQWIPGGVVVKGSVLMASRGAATKIAEACRRSNEITVESWLAPADLAQFGPARIVSLSEDPYRRNVTLGQERGRYDVRLRTTRAGENGMSPATASQGGVRTALSHVVYTRDKGGKARVTVDGKLNAERDIGGDLSNWDTGQRLGLANELTADRPWRGELHLVAIYARALSADEVMMNYRAGPEGGARKQP